MSELNDLNNAPLADDFVITGFAKVEGEWLALGSSPGVTIEGTGDIGPVQADSITVATGTLGSGYPSLALWDVAAKLNELEAEAKK